MWEADYCAGVTLWGWFYGKTWVDVEILCCSTKFSDVRLACSGRKVCEVA